MCIDKSLIGRIGKQNRSIVVMYVDNSLIGRRGKQECHCDIIL